MPADATREPSGLMAAARAPLSASLMLTTGRPASVSQTVIVASQLADTRRRPSGPEHVQRVKHYVDLYKDFLRPWHRTSRVFHHTPELAGREPHGWGVLELASADATRALVGLFRLAGPAEPTCHLRLRGLDLGRRYRVTFDNTGQCMACTGADLMHTGLAIRLGRALSSELLLVEG